MLTMDSHLKLMYYLLWFAWKWVHCIWQVNAVNGRVWGMDSFRALKIRNEGAKKVNNFVFFLLFITVCRSMQRMLLNWYLTDTKSSHILMYWTFDIYFLPISLSLCVCTFDRCKNGKEKVGPEIASAAEKKKKINYIKWCCWMSKSQTARKIIENA